MDVLMPQNTVSTPKAEEVASTTNVSTVHPRLKTIYRLLFPWVIGGVAAYIILSEIIIAMPVESWFALKQRASSTLLFSDYVVADNQSFGGDEIVIQKVRLKKSGYILARFMDAFHSPSDYIIGISLPLSKGVHTNVSIPIHPQDFVRRLPDGSLVWFPEMYQGMKVFVTVLYYENDQAYIAGQENGLQAYDIFGYPIMSTLVLK